MNIDRILPRLILIGDGFTGEAFSDAIVEAVRGGVRWVHLRDHRARKRAVELVAPSLIARIREVGVDAAISINGPIDVAQHLTLHYHARTHPDSVSEARRQLGPSTVIGYSAHDVAGAAAAVEAGADYVFVSPIFPTSSKPNVEALGVDTLRDYVEKLDDTPVFALGGLTPENTSECLEAGAYGIAVLSGILHAPDPAAAATRYTSELRT